jgi:hypothetical protein
MAYFIVEIGTTCSEEPEKAHSSGSPISGIVIVVCSDIEKNGGKKSKIGKEGGPGPARKSLTAYILNNDQRGRFSVQIFESVCL